MSLWTIAWRSIQRRRVASSLTALSMALGVALVVAVLLILGVVSESFRSNSSLGYHLVVGGTKGGRLQLVMNSVYYLSEPPENIPYDYYFEFLSADQVRSELNEDQLDELLRLRRGRLTPAEQRRLEELTPKEQEERLLKGQFSDSTHLAIPLAMGDYYGQYRVVGTSPKFFNDLVYDVENNLKYEVAEGEVFEHDSDEYGYFGAVAGATVAREHGLKLGDEFVSSHGSDDPTAKQHVHDPFRVVGILAPSGTPNDRAMFVNIEGFLLMEGHAKTVKEDAVEDLEHGADDPKPTAEEDHDHAAHEGEDDHDHAAHASEDGHDHAAHAGEDDHDHAAHESEDDHDHAAHAGEDGQRGRISTTRRTKVRTITITRPMPAKTTTITGTMRDTITAKASTVVTATAPCRLLSGR